MSQLIQPSLGLMDQAKNTVNAPNGIAFTNSPTVFARAMAIARRR